MIISADLKFMMRLLKIFRLSLVAVGFYLLPAASLLFAAPSVPAPEQVFGFKPGADYRLADYQQMVEYYRKLDEASDRVKVIEIGQSVEGRPLLLAIISSEANMAKLDRYRQISRDLARARIDPEKARALAAEGRAVVWIDGGLHASEVANAQHSPELAYRLVSDESPATRFIRDNVILLQVPVMNPDGLDLVVDWYKRNLGTMYETSPLPVLYHKYAGHDNNRDWYMMTQPETREISRILYQEWYPQIVLNHHQAPPFPARIFIPPYAPPMNPNIPPLVIRGIDMAGNAVAGRFEAEGKSGVISRMEFDAWWNGGMRTTPCFHNMVGLLVETALYNYATPFYYRAEDLPAQFKNGLPTLSPSPDYPSPWKGGAWRLSDAVDYMLTASLGVLDVAARYRDQWLLNVYRMGRNAIEAGQKGAPAAYLIPPDQQHDLSAAVRMVEALHLGGLDIEQAEAPFEVEGHSYPVGTYIIRSAQAYRSYLVDLMEQQTYPDRQAPDQSTEPYDMTGWTLPLQMRVRVVKTEEDPQVRTTPVTAPELPQVSSLTPAPRYLIERSWNGAFRLVNDLLKQGVPVQTSLAPIRLGDDVAAPGAFLVDGSYRAPLQELSLSLRIPVRSLSADTDVATRLLAHPRVGVYRTWSANQDEGWIRWLLEQYDFDYQPISEGSIREGELRGHFDAIILPSESIKRLVHGAPRGEMPPEFSSDGFGEEGARNLQQFVEKGGVLIASGASCELPLAFFSRSSDNRIELAPQGGISCPGSLLRIDVDANDPVAYGMETEAAAFFNDGEAFDLPAGAEGANGAVSVARYADKGILLSGWMKGEEQVSGKSAVVRSPLGAGQVVLLGFPPHFRGQAHGTFKLLFNSIYLAGEGASSLKTLATLAGSK